MDDDLLPSAIHCKDETHLRRRLTQLLCRPERQLSAAKMSEAAFLHIARSGLIRT